MAQAKQAIKFWMCGTCKWKNPITNNYCENCTEERPKQGCVVQVMTKQMLLNDWQQRKEIKNLNQGAKGTGAGLYNMIFL